jgi:biuret amidohydrolase
MQRDFLEPGGFAEMLGNDVSQLRHTIDPNRKVLAAWRSAGLQVIHTREGHRPDLADLPPAKKIRGHGKTSIGDQGPMGRILIRGEPGHDIIPELYPLPGEPVVDKPGKGAFFCYRPPRNPAKSRYPAVGCHGGDYGSLCQHDGA